MEILARGEAFRKDFLACSLWILSREITNDGQSCETGIPSPSCFKNLLFFRTERERDEKSVYRKCYGILLHDFKRNVSLFKNQR